VLRDHASAPSARRPAAPSERSVHHARDIPDTRAP
jgi:hypothetical protein